MPTLFAHDYSGSTSNAANYHAISRKEYLAAKAAADAAGDEVIILLWDTMYEVATEEKFLQIVDGLSGRGGTEPSHVADYIVKNDFHGRLVLLSDGQTYDASVARATEALGLDWRFERVDVHLVNTGGVVNMSVSCPFTRNSPHAVVDYDRAGAAKTSVDVSPEDLAAAAQFATLKTVADYEAQAEVLEKVVRARTMGTSGDPTLRDSILAMKKRIVEDASRSAGKKDTVAEFVAAVRSASADAPEGIEAAVALAGAVTSEYFAELNTGWSGSIGRLIGMCEGSLKGAFDLSGVNAAIQSDRARRAEEVEAVDAATVGPAASADPNAVPANFECPITLDTEADVLLLVVDGLVEQPAAAEGEGEKKDVPAHIPNLGLGPVLAGLDKTIVNLIADCPLNALNYPEVVAKIKAKLDHPVSLKAAQEAAAANAPINASPMTRRTVVGAIALGCTREQVRCTTAAIAKMVAEGKLLGSPDLWFAALWIMIERGDLPHLSHLAPAFAAQMKWRLANSTTFLSLSGLPELPTTRVPLGVAVWYVIAASALSLSGREEPIRAHLLHVDALLKLSELSGYALPAAATAHVSRLRALLSMLAASKKDRHRLPIVAKGMYQNMYAVDAAQVGDAVRALETVTQFIPLDGPATDASRAAVLATVPKAWARLGYKEVHALASMVDPSLSAGDISLPYDFAPVAEERWPAAADVQWKYGVERAADEVAAVPICAVTCRPFYKLPAPATGEWKDAASAFYGFAAAEQLPINRNYGDFVAKYRAYPTLDELLTFSHNRVVKGASGRTTLPACAPALAAMALAENAKVVAAEGYAPAEFRRRYLDTTTMEKRLPVESGAEAFVPVKPAE